MERAAGLTHDDSPQTRLDKLDAVLAQTSTSIHDAGLFAEMLSLPNDGRYPTLDLTPQQRRQKTLEALISQLEGLARQNPVLMVFEDAHWTDATSLEVFGRMRVLLIVTFRPEFDPPWIGRSHSTVMTINRLTKREAGAIIDSLRREVLVGMKGTGHQLAPIVAVENIIDGAVARRVPDRVFIRGFQIVDVQHLSGAGGLGKAIEQGLFLGQRHGPPLGLGASAARPPWS